MQAIDPMQRANSLARQGRIAEALAEIEPAIRAARPPPEVLEFQAALFKMAGDPEAALDPQRRLTLLYPQRRSGWHNLAATLGDIGLAAEAEMAARQCLEIPPPAPETLLVLGRSLQSQGRYDEAEAAFGHALDLRPAYAAAHRDLAQLRWMRTGDSARALARLAGAADDAELTLVKASVLEFAGDMPTARTIVSQALARQPDSIGLRLAASNLELALGRAEAALEHATIAYSARPGATPAQLAPLIQALLACGRAEEAARFVEPWLRGAPDDQLAIALQLTAWRALGDQRWKSLADYPALVRAFTLPTPAGWPTLAAYLDDLRATLLRLHDLKSHPLHQSLRGGSQTSQSLLRSRDPVIAAFFEAVQEPIGAYLRAVGTGDDPLRRRNSGSGRPTAAWSVNLRRQGRHANHVHPQGWISSAFYVQTPTAAIEGGNQSGWIRFGEPPFSPSPPQGPEHAVRPEPGRLVLFPSYLWHGTAPFETEESRLTIAFDILPG